MHQIIRVNLIKIYLKFFFRKVFDKYLVKTRKFIHNINLSFFSNKINLNLFRVVTSNEMTHATEANVRSDSRPTI